MQTGGVEGASPVYLEQIIVYDYLSPRLAGRVVGLNAIGRNYTCNYKPLPSVLPYTGYKCLYKLETSR